MLATVVAGAGHPAVAALFGVGAAGLAAAVVAMAWSVHAAQIRLAEQLARRQFIVTDESDVAARAAQNGHGAPEAAGPPDEEALGAGPAPPVVIEGPDTVLAGEQARYRVRPSGSRKVGICAAVYRAGHPVDSRVLQGVPPRVPCSVLKRHEGATGTIS